MTTGQHLSESAGDRREGCVGHSDQVQIGLGGDEVSEVLTSRQTQPGLCLRAAGGGMGGEPGKLETLGAQS
jgi:hypothetical protein